MGLSFPAKTLRESDGVGSALVLAWNDLVTGLRGSFAQVPRTVYCDLTIRTGQTAQAAFPLEVSLPDGFRPKVVLVGAVRNLDVPETQLHTQAVFCDWRPSPTGITVRYLTGLMSGAYAAATWAVTLKVESD